VRPPCATAPRKDPARFSPDGWSTVSGSGRPGRRAPDVHAGSTTRGGASPEGVRMRTRRRPPLAGGLPVLALAVAVLMPAASGPARGFLVVGGVPSQGLVVTAIGDGTSGPHVYRNRTYHRYTADPEHPREKSGGVVRTNRDEAHGLCCTGRQHRQGGHRLAPQPLAGPPAGRLPGGQAGRPPTHGGPRSGLRRRHAVPRRWGRIGRPQLIRATSSPHRARRSLRARSTR
jgi:hypothetical protein